MIPYIICIFFSLDTVARVSFMLFYSKKKILVFQRTIGLISSHHYRHVVLYVRQP